MSSATRRYEPFHRNAECQHYKRNSRCNQRKQTLYVKRSDSKLLRERQRKKLLSPSKNSSKFGEYIVTDENISNNLFKAIHESSQKEYACQIVEKENYREALLPYTLVSSNELINNIVDVLHGKKHVYFIFEKSYGDLHSYIRSKRKLKEAEASSLFKQIVNSVSYCHSVGVVVRDLKLRKFVFTDPSR